MSNRRFIEISSANRNRNQYPQPAEFEVPFAPPRTLNINQQVKGYCWATSPFTSGTISTINNQTLDVADPVTNGTIEYLWYDAASPVDASTVAAGTTIYNVYANALSSPYKTIPDFYVGYQLQAPNNLNASIIQSYNPSTRMFTLKTPLTTLPAVGAAINILNSSNLSATPYTLVLPGIDICGKKILSYDQAYNGYYVINETRTTALSIAYSKIVSYDYIYRTATLDPAITLSGWLNTDKYSIRKTLPNQSLTVTTNLTGLSSLSVPPAYTDKYSPLSISNCIFLGSGANSADNYYMGQCIYTYPTTITDNQTQTIYNIQGSCFYISGYIGGDVKACFVTPMNPPNVKAATAYYPSYESDQTKVVFPSSGSTINIVSFSNDNYNPLMYNGSVVSQNETVAYEISLVNLTLPNITLVTGARIAFYPYVYVEFTNVTAASSSSKNVIYSNNPNSNRALFLVPITDINDPLRSPFIKLDAGSMTQTVKFKPNDCLRFSVFLPDGTLYQTITSDYYSPSGPNPFCQIDALFGIKRLSGV
jgi:hypothetical protein